MKKIIAFAGSNSKTSINKKLVTYVANQVGNVEIEILDLNDYSMPLYGIDHETEKGIPEGAKVFLEKIKASEGIVLSLAEHNGAYSAVFKNIFDWMSRLDGKLWSNIPMLLMATSPGARGGATVLELASSRFKYMGGNVVSLFSLPSFHDNFSNEGMKDLDLNAKLRKAINVFEKSL